MENAVRKACVLQLSPAALADVCMTVNHLMRYMAYAMSGGTKQEEIDLLGRIARDVVPETTAWFMKCVDAQVLHMIGCWPMCENEVRTDLHPRTVALLITVPQP
jgi:hypothetical protein